MTGSEKPHSDAENAPSSRLSAIDRLIESLSKIQAELDEASLAMSAIHVNDAIEKLRIERVRLSAGL